MKAALSFAERYRTSISSVPKHLRNIVNKHGGLSEDHLLELILKPKDYSVDTPEIPPDNIVEFDYDVKVCLGIGSEAIQNKKVAYCIMAGGLGFDEKTPKALIKIPGIGMSLLTLKLFQAIGEGPIWIVVSPSSRELIEDHVQSQIGFDHDRIQFIEQYESYCITPDNQIIFNGEQPLLSPCGHGDLFPLMTHSKLLEKSINHGLEYISVVNVDNVMGHLDPVGIGRHITSKANVSCEVVEREEDDTGGFLCDVNGTYQILESYKIFGTDTRQFKWLNTNSFVFNSSLNISPLGREWNRVQKDINGKIIIRYERLLQEITDAYDTKYLGVKREDRFIPVKKESDLVIVERMLNANKV